MPYNETLAEQIRQNLYPLTAADEKNMFGGIAFMVDGNMTIGVIKDDLIVRVGPEKHQAALKAKGAKPFDFSGKPMSGWIMVAKAGHNDLQKWIDMALDFVRTLPPK
jgi:TfoX/Sxy family transcriptional regulator of competence genes